MRKTRYSEEFKKETARLAIQSGKGLSELSNELGVSRESIRQWTAKFGSSSSGQAVMEEEVRHLRAENRRLKMEQEILKKAAAFFAKEQF